MSRLRTTAVLAAACFCIAAGLALSSRPDVDVTSSPAPTTSTVMPTASPQYDPTNGLDVALRTFEHHQAAAAAEREAINQAILDALAPPPRYELPPAYVEAPAPTVTHTVIGGMFPSQSWWDAIQVCEGGGPGQWRTGYFGIEAGTPIGHLSYAEQLAMAQEIFNRAGPSAWGCWATVGGPW